MKTFFHILLLFCLSATVWADSLNDLNGVVAGELKVPFYNNDRLQAMVFAQNAEYRDQLLFGKEVIINLISKNADTDKVANDSKLQLYPLESTLFNVASFWLPERYLYSDAVIWTAAAVIDRVSRSASGNVTVKMRSPLVDLDGLGFSADFQKRQIRVNKEVKLVLRMTDSDPREFREFKEKKEVPAQYHRLNGKGDMLHLDMAENRIMLIGKVKIESDQVQLHCDRLTILLGGEKTQNSDDLELNAAGVQAIYADGNVRIQKIDKGGKIQDQQELQCDHLVFDVTKDQITLTNDKGMPRIRFGEKSFIEGRRMIFFRKKQQAIFPDSCFMQSFDVKEGIRTMSCDYGNLKLNDGICDLLGKVQMKAADGDLICDSMRVFLKKKKEIPKKSVNARTLIGDMKVNASEVERALCRGNVLLKRQDKGKLSTLNADKAALDYTKDCLAFEKNVVVSSSSGNLYTEKLNIQLNSAEQKSGFRSAAASGGVKIERLDPDGKSTLTAKNGNFDYARNRIEFAGKVFAVNGKSTMKCEKLELFLADKKESGSKDAGIPGLMETGETGKTLDHVIASGAVNIVDDGNTLDTDRCQLFFGSAVPGADKKPGFFQSGSLRMHRIVCDGSIVAKSREKKSQEVTSQKNLWSNSSGGRTLKAEHCVTDLIRHTSLFRGKVSLNNKENQLDCDKLELFAVPLTGGEKQVVKKASSIDDDPFAIQSENAVPQTIVFNKNMQLKKVISTGHVVFKHKDAEKLPQTLSCDKATFDGDEMIVRCESIPPKRPVLKAEGLTQTAEQYRILLTEERVEAVGSTEML